jgi:uncharacterized membrane protein
MTARRLATSLRAKLLAGLVVTVPAIVTVLALRFLLRTVDSVLGPAIAVLLGREVPGLGLLATAVLVLLLGMAATNLVGKRLIALVERAFTEVPLVRRIYGASKDIVESATLSQKQVFREVVMIEYPRLGVFSYGFVTGTTRRTGPSGAIDLVHVFIPTPPLPTTGAMVAVPADQVCRIDLSIEDALKLVISAGLAVPREIGVRAGT